MNTDNFTDEQIKRLIKVGGESVEELKERMSSMEKDLRANQPIIDAIATEGGKRSTRHSQKKTLGEAIADALEGKKEDIAEIGKNKNHKFSVEIKTSGILLASDHVTGDVQSTYGPAAIAPAQALNFRDLVPTVSSPTGVIINYIEGAVTNSFAQQTEGASKASQDYSWTEQKATSKYLAAKTKFSKQLMYNLPFLQDTLTLELTRDFYKKENDLFFTQAAGNATGVYTGTGTTDIDEIINTIASQRKNNYLPSYGIIDTAQWARILLTKPNDYSLPAGTVVNRDGSIVVAGTPIVVAPWGQTDHILLFDNRYIQRVETESMRIEFAYQNEDDWIKNLVCARLECFECLNLLRPESIQYHDFGNS